jgi:hypothetical protein
VAGALSGIVTSVNRVDGIYEEELAIRMQLIGNESAIIFLNGSTDPYNNNDGGAMLGQNQATIDDIIGTDNYDIGHVFSTGAGGIANLGCVCSSNSKAMSVTGSPNPVGDAFDVDYVAHEMGHAFGANHSFNATTEYCGGGNRAGNTAFEPGSGTTIMCYAGICGINDLQQHSDPFFHSGSFDEIVNYTTLGEGNDCPVISSTGNTPPKVPGGKNYFIPISTPFRLDGSATDADGDSLAYMWDEMDKGPACDWNHPSGQAPLFKSFVEDTLGYRYFPKLPCIVLNYSPIFKGEVLPDYARTINFRFLARDHHIGGGGVTYNDTMCKLTVVNTGIPFRVTFPNTAITWRIASLNTVTWDVASTNAAPINCESVNILLSIDGGYTYPIVLATNRPNDGNEKVVLPNDPSLIGNNKARVMVQSVGNVFFDISDHNFAIVQDNVPFPTQPDSGGVYPFNPFSNLTCSIYPNPVNDQLNIDVNGLNDESLTLSVHDVIGRMIYEYAVNQVSGEKYLTLDMSKFSGGVYVVKIKTGHGDFTEKIVKQ